MRSLFSDYINLTEIGRGGMATVYRATSKKNGNLVAIKVLDMHMMNDATALARFRQEASFRLNHPNIVRVLDHDVDTRGSQPFIVMEYVGGDSLEQVIQSEGKLSPEKLTPILKQVSSALDYAHSQGIVHRDVKPNNILIRTSDGQAVLADFGIAKTATFTAYTATMNRVGSAYFMSPEQAAGIPDISPASDIYSLGVTAYYALTGKHPFEGDDQIAIARQHIDDKPVHVSQVNSDVPAQIGNVVMQALNKSALQRPATAGEFTQRFSEATITSPRVIGQFGQFGAVGVGTNSVVGLGGSGARTASTQIPMVNPAQVSSAGSVQNVGTRVTQTRALETNIFDETPVPQQPAGRSRRLFIFALVAGLFLALLCGLMSLTTGIFNLGGGDTGGLNNTNTNANNSNGNNTSSGNAATATGGNANAGNTTPTGSGAAQATQNATGTTQGNATSAATSVATAKPGEIPITAYISTNPPIGTAQVTLVATAQNGVVVTVVSPTPQVIVGTAFVVVAPTRETATPRPSTTPRTPVVVPTATQPVFVPSDTPVPTATQTPSPIPSATPLPSATVAPSDTPTVPPTATLIPDTPTPTVTIVP